MTVDNLKELFIDKYGDCIFFTDLPEVKVVLTKDQYIELNKDIMKMSGENYPISYGGDIDPAILDNILYTKITVLNMCEFTIEIGQLFEFKLADERQEHGDETL